MTAPRRVVHNHPILFTRRCSERRFFLRPCEETNHLVQYVFGLASQRHGILLHGLSTMSDHLHSQLSDPRRELPAFAQCVAMLIARALNRRLGRRETFWAPGSYNAVHLLTPEDALDKLAYILANPTAAGLVARARDWPGLWTPPEQIGAGPIVVPRPDWFFRGEGGLPAAVTFELVPPPGFASPDAFRRRLNTELARREQEAAARMARDGRTFLGAERVRAESPFASARSVEPARTRIPWIACADPVLLKEAIVRLTTFLASYRTAWRAFADGCRDVLFPHGTYWMRVTYGVRCEAPD